MYKVTIADIAELTEEVLKVEIESITPDNSEARSSNVNVSLIITGKISYDSDKVFMKDSTREIAAWSMLKPDSPATYKAVTVEFDHTGVKRTYTLENAFVVSFTERFEDQNGHFVLKVRQKKDRLSGVKIS